MGSGAKIALVALLLLITVAIAKFVQNLGEENTIQPIASISQDGSLGQTIQVFDVSEKNHTITIKDLLTQTPNAKCRTVQKIMVIVYSEPNK